MVFGSALGEPVERGLFRKEPIVPDVGTVDDVALGHDADCLLDKGGALLALGQGTSYLVRIELDPVWDRATSVRPSERIDQETCPNLPPTCGMHRLSPL